ncbi:TPA: patatin [Candidatus Acetothermia bacterium]|nr:patatin [Candidatus Acetothermia bacterium]
MVQKKKVGLALGSGGARGSAHVGVLKILEENKIRPDVIVGTSMGAEVGGAYAAGIEVAELAAIWQSMTFGRVVKTLLPTIPWSGWSSGGEVLRTIRRLVGDLIIEELPLTYAAVATDLQTGLPYTITEGPLAQAIRASLSVPGLFTPVWIDGHLLIDGGVSNPVPVDVIRQLGAEMVIAVDVLVHPKEVRLSGIPVPDYRERILGIIKRMESSKPGENETRRFYPSVFTVLFQMSTVFQRRISELSLQAHPPDVLICPDFSPTPPCYSDVRNGIKAGEEAARRALPTIYKLLYSK